MTLLAKNAPSCKSLRPFTPRGWLRTASNFGKTRFRWSPTFHFSTQLFFSKLRTAVYPPRMAPIGLKLWENAFQVIPDIWFFDAKNFFRQKFLPEKFFVNTPKRVSAKCPFWRSCAGLDVTIRCASKIHCQTYRFQPSTTLGGGVKKGKTVFVVSFGRKKLIPSSLLWWYDTMILWYCDIMILWYYDIM